MRMRRLKWAQSFLQECPYLTNEPQQAKGNWKTSIGCEELHVEIGSGKGDYWIQMSEMYPQCGWIGIEKQESAAALALRKADHFQENRRFIYGDAENILDWFDDKEIDVIHLNFSDPWPKNRNKKRRLSNNRFLNKYRLLLNDNGLIIMKSDNRQLFEYTLVEMGQNGFELINCSLDFRADEHPEDATSEYERKFIEEGKPIYRGEWRKSNV